MKDQKLETAPFLLAMHSSSETLGVAVHDIRNSTEQILHSTFPIGRKLSNSLFNCVEEIIPSQNWSRLCRLAVAIGPGGFTGTRLSVVMARTLAQQLDCPLDGISSFALMAPRLARKLKFNEKNEPFWIVKNLPRRGDIAGRYLVKKNSEVFPKEEVHELIEPHLLNPGFDCSPSLQAEEDVEADVLQLLAICLAAHKEGKQSHWSEVTPIYPTSPVDSV